MSSTLSVSVRAMPQLNALGGHVDTFLPNGVPVDLYAAL
jgi:hypothetical protein